MSRLIFIVLLSLSRNSDGQNGATSGGNTGTIDVFDVDKICESPRRCVPYYQCLEDGTFNNRGVGVIINRFDNETGTETSTRICSYLESCCGEAPANKVKRELPQSSDDPGCGYSNPDGIDVKISSSDKAQFGEYPWMVVVMRKEAPRNNPKLVDNSKVAGSGSLIHPNVILTAAHILSDETANEFIVRAGVWDIQKDSKTFPYQQRNIKQIIRHEDYDSNGLLNDYALLIVDESFSLGPNIQPICLPTADTVFGDKNDCYSAGWGKEKFGFQVQRQTRMKKIRLSIVPFQTCEDKLHNTQLGNIFELHESFTCATGIAGRETCTGDGGSPLMCPVQNQLNRYYQAGIVAWGLGCGRENVPGVYANVGLAREWIDTKMYGIGFSSDSYSI